LSNYSHVEIEGTITESRSLAAIKAFPEHCTGREAIENLLASFDSERLYSGNVFEA
jgi:metal-dependent hydrolase (beta-lactamase superfamily II)